MNAALYAVKRYIALPWVPEHDRAKDLIGLQVRSSGDLELSVDSRCLELGTAGLEADRTVDVFQMRRSKEVTAQRQGASDVRGGDVAGAPSIVTIPLTL